MLRTIGGILAGIAVFMATLMVLELLAHQMFRTSREATIPSGMHVFVAVSYFLGALAGGLVAAKISGERWPAWLIAVLLAAGAAYTLTTFPHPLWMQVASIVAPLLGGLVASRAVTEHGRAATHADV